MVVVRNRGGKEQIVAALLYIFLVGIAVTVSESDREKKKKEERKRRGEKRTIVLFRLSRVARLTRFTLPSFPLRMFNYQRVKSNARFRFDASFPPLSILSPVLSTFGRETMKFPSERATFP